MCVYVYVPKNNDNCIYYVKCMEVNTRGKAQDHPHLKHFKCVSLEWHSQQPTKKLTSGYAMP